MKETNYRNSPRDAYNAYTRKRGHLKDKEERVAVTVTGLLLSNEKVQ